MAAMLRSHISTYFFNDATYVAYATAENNTFSNADNRKDDANKNKHVNSNFEGLCF